MAELVDWKVEGMSCTNCALSVERFLKDKGVAKVSVNFIGGEVQFESPTDSNTSLVDLAKGLDRLGYKVQGMDDNSKEKPRTEFLHNHLRRFLFCLVFTFPLWLHMVFMHSFLGNPWVQLLLTIPVFFVGMQFFGKSGFSSLRKGTANMNVLISIGAIASFGYSLFGTLTAQGSHFLFYDTTATIITLVFMGNFLEERSMQRTQKALKSLVISREIFASMIAYGADHEELIFSVKSNSLKVGDLILIRSGELVPMDCKILSGEASVDESILTGESLPVIKGAGDYLIGGSMLTDGNIKAYVSATGKDTVLNHILQLVKDAASQKAPLQLLADRISAVFVPLVLGIAVICFLGNYFLGGIDFSGSLLRSIAVLVIACPCAMGLATPAAIAVGLGRAAKKGILFKEAKSLELFKKVKQIVFDKTGTLTTGEFVIQDFDFNKELLSEPEFKALVYSMEKYSSHPIARCISKYWKSKNNIQWQKVHEQKGIGISATDTEGNLFWAASYKMMTSLPKNEEIHSLYLIKNDIVLGWVDVCDSLRPEAEEVIRRLKACGLRTVLLSGDNLTKVASIAKKLKIDEFYGEQSPEQKLVVIARLNAEQTTAMVGDGINDAPALAKADIGISLSDASHLAIQSADVVLMGHGLQNLPLALGLGRHTYLTIKQNLFWAFLYNIIAIPVACFGLLNPSFAALAMGLSDVVLGINSIRLSWKRVI